MFQATRRRLALWYAAVTAVLLLLFASGFYLYVRTTLVERVDDTLSHVAEIVQRSLVIEPGESGPRVLTAIGVLEPPVHINVEASFRDNTQAVEDDHIDLEWFSPTGELLWSTLIEPLDESLHVNPYGETVRTSDEQVLRQITQRVQRGNQVLGYLRVSHPWFEVTKPARQLMVDLALGITLMVSAVAGIGWLLSGIAIAPVRDSYQRLKQFTADASHELRNPIAVIQTNVQVALADPEPNLASQQGQLQVIERLTRRLGRLVDDLLFLTRQESGLIPPEYTELDLDLLLAEVVEEQQAIAYEHDITLRYQKDSSASAAAIWGNGDQLTRLFTNLIGNALQFTPTHGQVSLGLKAVKAQGQPWLQVKVQDTGIGIPPEALPRIYDRFYRADPTRSHSLNSASGTGLGLAIAKVIVDTHKGRIRIESSPNQGTTVTVALPTLI